MEQRLQLTDFLKVLIWNVENDEAGHDTQDSRPKMMPTKEPNIQSIQYIPDTAPDQHQPDNN